MDGRPLDNAFLGFHRQLLPAVEAELDAQLPPADEEPRRLHEAMRYCVLGGGKRIRPTLTVLAGESCGASRSSLLAPACALEMIHTFSLVHDDLPALDDDDQRRGQPTVHRVYDEALAILVGDALLAEGLWVLAEHPADLDPARRRRNVAIAARAVSSRGMIGGQADDLAAEGGDVVDPPAFLERIHRRKTGALLSAAAEIGASCGGADEDLESRIAAIAKVIGLMFQIRDDILDIEGDSEELGKTAGKDQRASKLTYPSIFGLARSKALLEEQRQIGYELCSPLARGRSRFEGLLDYLAARSS